MNMWQTLGRTVDASIGNLDDAHEAQLMHPDCTSGVTRWGPARFFRGTRQCEVVPKLCELFWIDTNEQRNS